MDQYQHGYEVGGIVGNLSSSVVTESINEREIIRSK